MGWGGVGGTFPPLKKKCVFFETGKWHSLCDAAVAFKPSEMRTHSDLVPGFRGRDTKVLLRP